MKSAGSEENSICRRTTISPCVRRIGREAFITSRTSFIIGGNTWPPARREENRTHRNPISPPWATQCAEAATGERLIFFNDDVETAQPDSIQNLIEPLENPEVGAVSPKLLYETGKIQHAGLVMGVRGLAGTAFHQRDADSTEHFNLAQSLRDVAALSAACLAMRRNDFFRVGGFDAVNTPIAHSDVDLCFKIREAGLRCVYTPCAPLRHAGHASIAVEEKKETKRSRNKASIYLLKRWARYTTHDPYFPDNMRDWLYTDSPTPIRMVARDRPESVKSARDLLLVSHDLSLSGAP